MNDSRLDQIVQAYLSHNDGLSQETLQQQYRLKKLMLQLLSSGKPVSAGDFSAQIQLPVDQVKLQFEMMKQTGFEFDETGNLAGAALTLKSTPHHFQVKGHDLFAWCALDTIFLPSFIGEPAFIESKCPITGEMIELTVSPHGIETYSPPDTVMSITIPGISCSLDITGPQSDTCSQMHFFSSRRAAETWLKDHPDVEILTIEETWQFVRQVYIEPYLNPSDKLEANYEH